MLAGITANGHLRYLGLSTLVGMLAVAYLPLIGAVAVAIAVWGVPAAVRRRGLVLIAPVIVLFLTVRIGLAGWLYSNDDLGHLVYLVPAQWVALAVVPLLTLALGFVLLRRREQTLRLVALGRAADRNAASGG